MSRRNTLPDDSGWYWVKTVDEEWKMAYVHTGIERVLFIDGEHPMDFETDSRAFDQDFSDCDWWYGPFECPGGDFGGNTVIVDEDRHEEAEADGSVIVLKHFDFGHCRDEKYHSRFTTTSLVTRDEAESQMGLT